MDITTFISENYVVIIIVAVVLLMTIIGYFSQKILFGKKVSEHNEKDRELDIKDKNEQIEILNENSMNNSNNEQNNEIEKLDILDSIAPNFNNGGLVVGDVNQNPSKTNEELGIPEDLYAPFGDENIQVEPSIDELKIEDVSETDDFNIIEKDNTQNNDDVDESIIKDINESLELSNDQDAENLNVEDVQNLESQNIDADSTNTSEPIIEEINNLVDNTFVINDGTNDFETSTSSQETVPNKEETEISEEDSKVEKFNIDENDISVEEPSDLEIEATTNLKLDEINEKIKNLKLEDLDNPIFEEDLENDLKKSKRKKQISVKSVDEIKKTSNQKKQQKIEDVAEMNLPDLDAISTDNKEVDEADDIWNF